MSGTSKMLTGADILAETLVRQGVETIFCITGAGNLELVEACATRGISFIYSHHEQAAVMEAIGWSRVSGRIGVVMVTTGAGAANSLTGILSAHLDSVPVLVIAGNESTVHIENMKDLRAFGVQGFDSVSVAKPICKFSIRLQNVVDIAPIIDRAFESCLENRPGPGFIEFPTDVQRQKSPPPPRRVKKKAPIGASIVDEAAPSERGVDPQVYRLARSILRAKRPILYFGEGIRLSGAITRALEFAEKWEIPFVLSWSAIDFCGADHPLNLGRGGIYGERATNIAIQKADVLLAIGTRLAIPQVGYERNDFARNAERWVVDIDETELSKFDAATWNLIHCDARVFIEDLASRAEGFMESRETKPWLEMLSELGEAFPLSEQVAPPVGGGFIHSFDFVGALSRCLSESAIIVTDAAGSLLTTFYGIRIKPGQRMFASQGLSEMGGGLPSAIGAKIAAPDSPVLCVSTDGSIMLNLQELQVANTYKLRIKLVVLNNEGYGMIRASQDNLSLKRSGSESGDDLGFPDFEKVARTFDMGHTLIDSTEQLQEKLQALMDSGTAELIEVRMSPDQLYLPRLGTVKNKDGSLSSPPLENMVPLIREELLTYWLERA